MQVFKLEINGNNAKRMRFQTQGLDNVKLSELARFCIESFKAPFLYDANNDVKTLQQTIIRMANLSSINCFYTHGNVQTDPVAQRARQAHRRAAARRAAEV